MQASRRLVRCSRTHNATAGAALQEMILRVDNLFKRGRGPESRRKMKASPSAASALPCVC